MTERIDHTAKALDLIDPKRVTRLDTDAYLNRRVSEAQVHATLALVEQQRIANLIAVYGSTGEVESGYESRTVDFGFFVDQIREGLGL